MFMFIVFSNFLYSQNGNIALTWDKEVGCQSYSYNEEIGANFCKPQPKIITVSPTPAEPDSIIGNTQVCAGIPLIYSVGSPQFGFLYEWQVVSSTTGATAGVFYGGNYGNSVTLAFMPSFSSYIVKVRSKQIDAPYCSSEYTILNVNKIIPNVTIVGENSICASTSATYFTNYTEADEYIWSINPSVAGSITQNPSNPTQITVLWNNYAGPGIPQVKLRVRKCTTFFAAPSVNINLLFTPEITLSAPTTVCKGEAFTVSINATPSITSIDHIDWDFGDGTITTVYPTSSSFLTSPSHSYNLTIASNTDYDISAVIYGANGCIYPATAIHTITVLPTIQADISPAVGLYFCDEGDIVAQFDVNIQEGIGNATLIEWYHNGTLISLATNSTQINPISFGEYYALVYNDNLCVTQTNSVFIITLGCDDACTINPAMPPITSIPLDCNSFTASVPNIPTPLPDDIHWSVSGGGTITFQDDLNCQFNFTAPGNHILFYEANYHEGEKTCLNASKKSIIIPYKADMKYLVSCTETSNIYQVNLLNHSVIFAGYDVENYSYFYNGSWHNNGTNPNTTINLPPGIHNVGIKISRAGFLPCEYFTTIDLPNYPTANFTYVSSTCPNQAILFTALDTDPGNTYLWNFGDGSQNFQQNPTKEYENSSNFPISVNVTLTVTNRVGCSTTYSPPGEIDINVFGVNMQGTFETNPSNATVCEGSSVILTYTPSSSSQIPISYEWFREDELVATTTIPSYAVTESGGYWLQGVNVNGCKKSILGSIVVTIVPTPQAIIRGTTSVCVNTNFKLDGTVGGSSTYSWTLDGNPISNASDIYTSISTPGTYVFGLEIKTLNGSGGYCSSSTMHTLTVLDFPSVPTIEITNVQCNPYRVTLTATTSESGSFSWSNGISDPTVANGSQTFSSGGPIRVRFTNEAGCSVTADYKVPKHPSFYSWVFPKGCYEFCNQDFDDRYLIGPLQLMPSWAWLIDASIVNHGENSEVENLTVNHPGDYQLSLGNGLCPEITTAPINISIIPECRKCSVAVETNYVEQIDDSSGFVSYLVKLNITSSYGGGIYATLHNLSGGGSFIPSAVTLSSGPNPFTFIFVAPAGFTSGVLNFYLSIDNFNILCDKAFEIEFPIIDFENKTDQNKQSKTTSFVVAAPNPSSSETTIYYDFVQTENNLQKIAVYDLTGRLIYETPCNSKGIKTIDFSGFPSGIYSIQLLDGNTKVQQTKFIKQ